MMARPRTIFLVAIFVLVASALQVTPGSSCAAFCLDEENGDPFDPKSSNTNATDIVCDDRDYYSSPEGLKYKQCIECLQKSKKVNETESDLAWMSYNLRYALGTCLYGYGDDSKVINSPCVINWACQPLKDAVLDGFSDDGGFNDGGNIWGFCDADSSALKGKNMESCMSCLSSSDEETYLSNFLVTLQAGCEQRPTPGKLLGLSGSPFSSTSLNITDAPTDISEKDPGASSSTMTTGTIVGIAIGAGLLLLGGLALFWVYFRKQKAMKRAYGDLGVEKAEGPDSRSSSRAMITNTQWGGGSSRGGSMTMNAEYYDKMEEAGGAGLPTHPAYLPRTHSRGSSRNETPTPPPGAYQPGTAAPGGSLPAAYNINRWKNAPENPSNLHNVTTITNISAPQFSASAKPAAPSVAPKPSSNTTIPANFVPPPPPPRGEQSKPSNVPAIKVPSVPKLKVPKKYTPPTINIEPPSAVDDPSSATFKKVISGPLNLEASLQQGQSRFKDRPLAGANVAGSIKNGPQQQQHQRQGSSGSGRSAWERPVQTGRSLY